jgi:hypothetical protein
MRSYRKAILFAAVFPLIFLTVAGCDYLPFGYTPIGDINQNPGRYEGREVRVRGEVTSISKLPFLELKSYTMMDDSGEITVLTEGALPAMGDTVAIKADVKTTAIIDRESFGLRLEEIKKLPTL